MGGFQLDPDDIRRYAQQIIREQLHEVEMLTVAEFLERRVPDDLSHDDYDRACADVENAIASARIDVNIHWPDD